MTAKCHVIVMWEVLQAFSHIAVMFVVSIAKCMENDSYLGLVRWCSHELKLLQASMPHVEKPISVNLMFLICLGVNEL